MANSSLPASGNVTRLTILGLLTYRPMHGYQLRREIELRRMERWADIKSGSIYQALIKLKNEGLVEETGKTKHGNRPSRLTYRITKSGRAMLKDLLCHAWSTPQRMADPVDVALSFVTLLRPDKVVELISHRIIVLDGMIAEISNEKKNITTSSTGVKLMVMDLIKHRLNTLKADKKWAEGILKNAKAHAYAIDDS